MVELQANPLPVREQGDRGTCVGFATAAAHELVLESEQPQAPEDVLWAAHELMGRATGDETSVELALFGLAAEEGSTEKAWPYGNPHWSAGRPQAALRQLNRRRLPSWRRMDDVSIAAIRDALRAGSAIILTLEIVKPAWLNPPNGLIDAGEGATVRGNHAVAVVGAAEDTERDQLLRIRNSWGEKWADNGYAQLSKRYLESYAVCAHALGGKI